MNGTDACCHMLSEQSLVISVRSKENVDTILDLALYIKNSQPRLSNITEVKVDCLYPAKNFTYSAELHLLLKYIALYGPNIRYFSCNSSDLCSDALVEFVSKCKSLRGVDLSSCKRVGDKLICALVKHCSKMEELILYHENEVLPIGSATIDYITKRLPNIRKLHVYGAEGLTDRDIKKLADSCTSLYELDISKCKGITDLGIGYISRLPLQYLFVNDMTHILKGALSSLISSCGTLTFVEMNRFQRRIVEELIHNYPQVEFQCR